MLKVGFFRVRSPGVAPRVITKYYPSIRRGYLSFIIHNPVIPLNHPVYPVLFRDVLILSQLIPVMIH